MKKYRKYIIFHLLICALLCTQNAYAQNKYYSQKSPTPDGTGKYYMGREISKVIDGPGAIIWLERTSRESEEDPNKIIEALELKPTDIVADIGAGSGYLSFRIAKKVPQGKVFAVDVSKDMVGYILNRRIRENVPNVVPVLGEVARTTLKNDSIDIALMVDAYHEFLHPREMMVSIVNSLRKGGRVVFVEYKGEDASIAIKPLHKMTVAQVKKEMSILNLQWVKTVDSLPIQHIIIFEKPY